MFPPSARSRANRVSKPSNKAVVRYSKPIKRYQKRDTELPGCSRNCLSAIRDYDKGLQRRKKVVSRTRQAPSRINDEKGFDGDQDTDDEDDANVANSMDTLKPDPITMIEARRDLEPVSRIGVILRVLARSLHYCSMGIAAGFGLSYQQSAWYKHCWTSPKSQVKNRLYPLDLQPKVREYTAATVPNISKAPRVLPSQGSSTEL
ncbi:hypothetical protein KR018_009257 [Drosophila ironensis]|nr:hypothetical protein KR018_009257 [Drosophila ironensis]